MDISEIELGVGVYVVVGNSVTAARLGLNAPIRKQMWRCYSLSTLQPLHRPDRIYIFQVSRIVAMNHTPAASDISNCQRIQNQHQRR